MDVDPALQGGVAVPVVDVGELVLAGDGGAVLVLTLHPSIGALVARSSTSREAPRGPRCPVGRAEFRAVPRSQGVRRRRPRRSGLVPGSINGGVVRPLTNPRRMLPAAAAALAGSTAAVSVTVVLWLVLLPWDLSEIDAEGNPTGSSLDQRWLSFALILLVILAVGIWAAWLRHPIISVSWTIAGAMMWAGLFAWRASSARVSGANFWFLAFFLFVGPAAFGVSSFVTYLARERRQRKPPAPAQLPEAE